METKYDWYSKTIRFGFFYITYTFDSEITKVVVWRNTTQRNI